MRAKHGLRARDHATCSKLVVVLAVLAITPVAVSWVAFVASPAPANDFAVFYTSGVLVAEGRADSLYDVEEFQAAYMEATGRTPSQSGTLYGNTPAFAQVLRPLAELDFNTAWIVWTLLGLIAISVATSIVVPAGHRAAWFIVPLFLSQPALSTIGAGQSTFFWMLLMALILVSIERQRWTVAGTLIGLLILKPSLLVGLGVWLLLDHRMRRVLAAACVSAAGLCLVSYLTVGSVWLDYPAGAANFAQIHRFSPGLLAQFSPWGLVDLLRPGWTITATAFGVAAAAFGLWIFRRFLEDSAVDPPIAFAGAVFAGMWLSPHVLVHDWLLLAIAFGAIWRSRPDRARKLIISAAVIAATASSSLLLSRAMFSHFGWAGQVAMFGLAFVCWQLFSLRSPMEEWEHGSESNAARTVIDLRSEVSGAITNAASDAPLTAERVAELL